MPSLINTAMLMAAGSLAGFVNAIAGGGTFFTFAALMAAGLPPVAANATSAVSVLPGQISSTFAYRREVLEIGTKLIPLGVVSAVGGLIGGWLLLYTDNTTFQGLVPWLLLTATVLFAVSPRIPTWIKSVRDQRGDSVRSRPTMGIAAIALQGLVAIYGGYFGAGMGIMMLASLSLVFQDQFHAANAAKNILAVLMQGFAVCMFIISGIVHWPEAIIVMGSSVVGGWLGVVIAKHVTAKLIRWSVVLSGAALSFWYFLH